MEFCISTTLYLAIGCGPPQVQITEGVISEGQVCFQIATPTAKYLYQKDAGGFSNIYDNQGVDWIQFDKSGNQSYPESAASDYRGLPNLVFGSDDGGVGHPGFDKAISDAVGKNKIRSHSKSRKWQWTWTFYDRYAELEIEKTDPEHAYWFLYEGPIAGKFSPKSHYWGTNNRGPLKATPDLIKGSEMYENWQTVYFGDRDHDRVFFIHQLQPDTLKDLYAYLGNDLELANASSDGMVVFGFGREKGATPLMTSGQKFRIGFHQANIKNTEDHYRLIKYIRSLNNKK